MSQEIANHWFILLTRKNWEKKVLKQLYNKGFDCYCPINKFKINGSNLKFRLEPLFPCYVFIRTNSLDKFPIKEIMGLTNFVYWLKKPAVIKNEEIDVIRRLLESYNDLVLDKFNVKVGEQPKVLSSPLIYREGNVMEIKHKALKVTLPSLGYTITAEVNHSNIELVRELETSITVFAS